MPKVVGVLTVVSDPATGLLYESGKVWRDASTAFRNRREEFKPLQESTRALLTPDGCTVGENAAWLMPGEYVVWDGLVCEIG